MKTLATLIAAAALTSCSYVSGSAAASHQPTMVATGMRILASDDIGKQRAKLLGLRIQKLKQLKAMEDAENQRRAIALLALQERLIDILALQGRIDRLRQRKTAMDDAEFKRRVDILVLRGRIKRLRQPKTSDDIGKQ